MFGFSEIGAFAWQEFPARLVDLAAKLGRVILVPRYNARIEVGPQQAGTLVTKP